MCGLNPKNDVKTPDRGAETQNVMEQKKTQFVGKGGEYLITGRLILHGYNASMPMVDEGIDMVAVKDSRMYGIQVKTANKNTTGYVADINVSAYNRTDSGNTFYVFVLLGESEWYVILPFHTIAELIDEKYVKTIDKGNRYRATFAKKDGTILLAKKDAKRYVDNWELIK